MLTTRHGASPSPRAILRGAEAAAAAMGLNDDEAARIEAVLSSLYAGDPPPWPMRRQAARVVKALMDARGKLVSNSALLTVVDSEGEQTCARRAINDARKAIPDPAWIQNVWGQGYRWAGPLEPTP